jgi:two-component system OmpR family response regulator
MGTKSRPTTADDDPRQLVLVADDDKDLRVYIGFLMRRAGYRVLETGDGARALKMTMTERPDLVLLDIGMPNLDGYAVGRVLQNLGAKAPTLIYISGRTSDQDRENGFQLGAADFVTKPFKGSELVERAQAALSQAVQAA